MAKIKEKVSTENIDDCTVEAPIEKETSQNVSKKQSREGTINAHTFAKSIGKPFIANLLIKTNNKSYYATHETWAELLKKIGG